jgi:hypothetical protein
MVDIIEGEKKFLNFFWHKKFPTPLVRMKLEQEIEHTTNNLSFK